MSSEGRVWRGTFADMAGRVRAGRFVARSYDSDRYLMVHLNSGGRRRTAHVHTLVLEAFVGPGLGRQCRHLDGNKENNSSDNLVWGTSLENHADRLRHGRVPSGVAHPNAKLTQEKVDHMRALRASGFSKAQLARNFGVSATHVARVLAGKAWGK